jgi:spore coat protein A, manganese oxidase
MFDKGGIFSKHRRPVGGPALPFRTRWLAGLAGVSLVGAGSLMYGPLAFSALADEPPPCGQAATSPRPTFFTDEAGQPLVATPDSKNHYTLTAHMGTHSFHSGWPAVDTLGYSTANQKMDYLGPTIVTKEGTPVDVKIVNGLPAAGTVMFPFGYPTTANTVVLHRHGGLQSALSDGAPDQMVAPGGSRTNHYPNDQAAASLWYHDHADATTSFNVYAGLAGFMPNTDTLEPGFNLPAGDFSRAYVLQDKSFNADHSLCYTHASPEFFGDLPVINGTIAPRQTVQPRRYTFTFINGSDSRFYHLTLRPDTGTSGTAPKMTVVGSDSGYVLKPAKVNDLLIAPGERYKVVVDFTGHSGRWVLSNDAVTPFPDGDPDVSSIPQLMRFDVGTRATGVDRSSVPSTIVETNNVVPPAVSLLTARLRVVQAGELSPGVPQLGDKADLRTFIDPATETPKLGSTEAWAMENHSPDTHPIHEHLVELRLVGRWPVVWDENTVATGHPVALSIGAFQPPGAFESGPKDTFVAPKDYITVWVGQYTIGGKSVWHCHILSHEDSSIVEMMRPLVVGSAPQTQLPIIGTQARLDRLIRRS